MAEIRPEEHTKTSGTREPLSVRDTVSKIRPVLLINEGNLGLKKNHWNVQSKLAHIKH